MLKRFAILVLVLASLIGGTLLAPNFSWQIGQLPIAAELDVKARDLNLVCPGPLFKAGGVDGSVLGEFAPVGVASYSSSFNPTAGASLQTGNGSYTVIDPTGSETQGSALLNASQTQLSSGATLKGLAATNCQLPSNDLWLVGGDTTTGREALLILRNPTQVDATVSLEIIGEGGSVAAPGLSGIAAVAGKTTVIPLAGIVPKTKTFVTHVQSKGGAIAAWIQQRTVRGLSAGGLDYISPSPDAAKQIVIPGLFIRGSKYAQNLIAENSDYADVSPVLRVFVPGEQNATVTAQIMGADEKTFGTVIRATVSAGTTTDLDIPGLKDGDYVALISADVEIMASIRLPRSVSGKAPDFAWLPAAELLSGNQKITAPAQGISKICIYRPGTDEISIAVVSPGSTYSFAAGDERYANLIIDVDGTVASLPVLDQKNVGGKVSVNVR